MAQLTLPVESIYTGSHLQCVCIGTTWTGHVYLEVISGDTWSHHKITSKISTVYFCMTNIGVLSRVM